MANKHNRKYADLYKLLAALLDDPEDAQRLAELDSCFFEFLEHFLECDGCCSLLDSTLGSDDPQKREKAEKLIKVIDAMTRSKIGIAFIRLS